jgi:hypothetical protein
LLRPGHSNLERDPAMRSLPRQQLTNRHAGSIALVGLVTVLVLGWTCADLGANEATGRLGSHHPVLAPAHDVADSALHMMQPSSPARTRIVVMIALLLVIAGCSTRRIGARRRPGDDGLPPASSELVTAGPRAPPARAV